MTNKAPRLVTSQMLIDALPPFEELCGHCLENVKEPELAVIEQEAHEICSDFFKSGDGKQNGALVVGALFVIFKMVEKFRRDTGRIDEQPTNSFIQ